MYAEIRMPSAFAKDNLIRDTTLHMWSITAYVAYIHTLMQEPGARFLTVCVHTSDSEVCVYLKLHPLSQTTEC